MKRPLDTGTVVRPELTDGIGDKFEVFRGYREIGHPDHSVSVSGLCRPPVVQDYFNKVLKFIRFFKALAHLDRENFEKLGHPVCV
jgi:hypothetical protein